MDQLEESKPNLEQAREALARASLVERTAPDDALALSNAAIAVVERDASPPCRSIHAHALIQRARALFFKRMLAAACDDATAAEAIFNEVGDADGVVRANAAQGSVFSALGHDEAALERLEIGRRLARNASVTVEARVRVLAQRASALRDAGRTEEALEALEEALPLAEDLGKPTALCTLLLNQAAAATRAGHLELADQALARARKHITAQRLDGLVGWLAALEGASALAQGDLERARVRAAEGIDAGGDGDARVNAVRTWAQAVSLHPRASAEERAHARERLIELVEEARGKGWVGDLPAICRDLADLCERSGDLSASIQWHKETGVAREVADRSRRQRRLEAERLHIELQRLAVEAEQHRLRSEMLAEGNTRLALLSEERARLLAMVAHDLRAPLTAIGMCVEHQTRALHDGRGTDAGQTLETIAIAATRMTELIDAALSTDSIRRGQVSPRVHQFDVVDLVRRCVHGLGPLAARKDIRLELPSGGPIVLRTDAPALSRIVENLVTNALKFTPRRRSVRTFVHDESPWVVFVVEDEGPGFRAGEGSDLFELGKTGAARPTGGEASSGIGLSVVRDLVAALGGEIALGNRPDGGARVSVRLRSRVP